MDYDSRPETKAHIAEVSKAILDIVNALTQRALAHDKSKLILPERRGFDEFTPKLKGSTYGSEEYKEFLAALKPVLDHHYAENRHHPEHHKDGIRDMTLVDLVEMFCDWRAATLRHADGDIRKSIEINKGRFGYSEELASIFQNTARELWFGESAGDA